ncbi:MAG: hypothetical protein ACQGVC_15375 [Myxococcota bacterium]
MSEATGRGAGWLAGVAVLGAIALGAWLVLRDAPAGQQPGDDAPRPQAESAPAAPERVEIEVDGGTASAFRIEEQGRLTIEAADLPEDAPLELVLELPADARGSGDHTARVVSERGERIDVTASPLPDADTGLRLAIEPGFLQPGRRYMIEVDIEGNHPLSIRRYVVEVR